MVKTGCVPEIPPSTIRSRLATIKQQSQRTEARARENDMIFVRSTGSNRDLSGRVLNLSAAQEHRHGVDTSSLWRESHGVLAGDGGRNRGNVDSQREVVSGVEDRDLEVLRLIQTGAHVA